MPSIVFETPGELDLRALTTFGISSKPTTDNPIGFFGTGLKYAVAVFSRLDCSVEIINDAGGRLEVVKQPTQFRGKEFEALALRSAVDGKELPFTTELGKTWEPWQAFRELEANTRDEGGRTYLAAGERGKPGHTRIVVSGRAALDAFDERDSIFLNVSEFLKLNSLVRVAKRESEHVFYRGMRVLDVKPTTFAYDIVADLDLTEDRTAKYESGVRGLILEAIAGGENEDFLHAVMGADETGFEGSLEFDRMWLNTSLVFDAVAAERIKKKLPVLSRIRARYDRLRRVAIERAERIPYASIRMTLPDAKKASSAIDWIEREFDLVATFPDDGQGDLAMFRAMADALKTCVERMENSEGNDDDEEDACA